MHTAASFPLVLQFEVETILNVQPNQRPCRCFETRVAFSPIRVPRSTRTLTLGTQAAVHPRRRLFHGAAQANRVERFIM